MHSMNQLKQTPLPLRIAFILACFAVLPGAQALLPPPPPDGGYPQGNTAEGDNALYNLTSGSANTAVGFEALVNNTIGSANTAVGVQALYHLTSGQNNTAVGDSALYANTIGVTNTATGAYALAENTTGNQNTATGLAALQFNTIANYNTAHGYFALVHNTGASNTAIGSKALWHNSTGSSNIGLGVSAGANLTTGSNNIAIGNFGVAAESNTIRIGRVQTRTFIKGISGVAIAGAQVVVNAGGQLGVTASSKRFKDDIEPMDKASEALFALKPVIFRYNKEIDPEGTPQFGLAAEDVEKINPDLVVHDPDGKPYTVRYDAFNAMLLNEFLKEHKTLKQQQSEIDALKAELKQQRTLIQKVSAQLEVSKPAPKTVLNSQ